MIGYIDFSGTLFDIINNIISAIVTILSLIGIIAFFIYTLIQNHKKYGLGKGGYFSVITFILLQFPLWGIILLPQYLVFVAVSREVAFLLSHSVEITQTTPIDALDSLATLRWFSVYAVLPILVFSVTQKYSGVKSTVAIFVHLSVFLLGWLEGKWFGVVFISLPIVATFYLLLYHLALVIFPSSAPENKDEKRNKFLALFWYIWGAQYPFWVADSSATRKIEKHVDGNYFKGFGRPGIVWTHSHQVVGQSLGIEFNSAKGPGTVFSEQYERPVAIIDLRTQLRTAVFEAVTKDGITIKAVVFTSFKTDPEDWSEWDKETRHRVWRNSPILQNGMKADQEIGSYPYSTARIHAVLSTAGIGDSTDDDETPTIYWDEIVVQRIVKEARFILSERTFDELWTPLEDRRGASALDEIGTDLKDRAIPRLQEIGVQLFASRVVNYLIDKEDPVYIQLAGTWMAAWDQRINSIKLDGDTKTKELLSQAETSSKAVLLASITESLAKARELDEDLPKQMVALNFIATLKGLLQDEDSGDTELRDTRLEVLKELILRNR